MKKKKTKKKKKKNKTTIAIIVTMPIASSIVLSNSTGTRTSLRHKNLNRPPDNTRKGTLGTKET